VSVELIVPPARELGALSPSDRWNLEDALDEARGTLREFNDDEIRRWVEVEGKTQTWIAEQVGQSQKTVSRRCERLSIQPVSNRGRPRNSHSTNSDEPEVIDAEVVEDSEEPEWVQCHGCGRLVRVDRPHRCAALASGDELSDRQRPVALANKRQIEAIVRTCNVLARWSGDRPVKAIGTVLAVSSPEEVEGWREAVREAQKALGDLDRWLGGDR
jgi:hypothetical protein